VTASTDGVYDNTIPAGNVTSSQGASNTAPATARLTVNRAASVVLSKAHSPDNILLNGTSVLTITIANTNAGAIALSGMTLMDPLPSGVLVAGVPNASTTCGAGTVHALSGESSVTLNGGSVAAGATCTFVVTVTGVALGTHTDVIAAGELSSTQGATNAAPASAPLTVRTADVVLTKAFSPDTIAPNGISRLSIAIGNTAANATALTGVGLVDTLPSGVKVATTPNAATTCGGTVSVAAGGSSLRLSGGSVVAGATCTIGVNVTATAPGRYANTIPANTLTSAQSASNSQPVTAVLTVGTVPSVVIRKSFTPPTITANGTTVLTIAIDSSATDAVALTGIALTDVFPTGLRVAASPNAATDCGSATVSATPGGSSVSLTGGSEAAGAVCTITVTVTANTAGEFVDTIPANALTTTQGSTNSAPASATLVVGSSTLHVTKTTTATAVTTGDRADYVITVAPPGPAALAKTTVVDTLPQFQLYGPGTARVNGRPLEPVVAGRTLTWTLPNLTGTVTITYSTVITAGAAPSSILTNNVEATATPVGGAPLLHGFASASVEVVGNTLGSCYPITGRVYLDTAGTGHFEPGDAGIAHVRIYLDDGESVETDAQGRYNFPCVRPGMHALRLDETTLPEGVTPYDDRNIDSEKSIRRLVHRVFDQTIIEDINFAVTGSLPPSQP
jgi:uncharacterized repeat protein (TIGR01451 family)